VAIVQTQGNPDCHVILRGGKAPNYDAQSVAAACQDLAKAHLPTSLMVDCSHANSSKQHEKQLDVARDIANQIAGGSRSIFGVMVESHLLAGAQKFTPAKTKLLSWNTARALQMPAWVGTILCRVLKCFRKRLRHVARVKRNHRLAQPSLAL